MQPHRWAAAHPSWVTPSGASVAPMGMNRRAAVRPAARVGLQEAEAPMSNPTISAYDPIPSVSRRCSVTVRPDMPSVTDVGALAVPVVGGGDPPPELGVDAASLTSAGFTGARGQTLVLPHPDGVVRVAVGLGTAGT